MSIIRVTRDRHTEVAKWNPNVFISEIITVKVYVLGICVYKYEYIHTPLT